MRMKAIEYEFTLADGSKRHEFVDLDAGYSLIRQIEMFKKMHGAIAAKPVDNNQSPAK
jgi:hypothetical protein